MTQVETCVSEHRCPYRQLMEEPTDWQWPTSVLFACIVLRMGYAISSQGPWTFLCLKLRLMGESHPEYSTIALAIFSLTLTSKKPSSQSFSLHLATVLCPSIMTMAVIVISSMTELLGPLAQCFYIHHPG